MDFNNVVFLLKYSKKKVGIKSSYIIYPLINYSKKIYASVLKMYIFLWSKRKMCHLLILGEWINDSTIDQIFMLTMKVFSHNSINFTYR